MRLALNLGVRGFDPGTGGAEQVALAREAEQLGFSCVWAAEAYGSDAATVLAWVAACTSSIGIGSAVFQIPGRTPALTAMTAATLDGLSGGRFRLGLGVSGPQVSEGWHGVRFNWPLNRTREYVDIVRMALRRETVEYAGEHWTLPLPGGAGKPLRLAVRPVRPDLPVYLAAIGPRNLELTGEVADGWLAIFFSPAHSGDLLGLVRTGRARVGRDLTGFDVVATVPLSAGADVQACADAVRGYAALYVGGMGSRTQNFYHRLAVWMGYADAAREVQEHFLAGRVRDAASAVPFAFLDETSLLGPVERLADRMQAFAAAGVTTLAVTPHAGSAEERVGSLRVAAEALDRSGVGE